MKRQESTMIMSLCNKGNCCNPWKYSHLKKRLVKYIVYLEIPSFAMIFHITLIHKKAIGSSKLTQITLKGYMRYLSLPALRRIVTNYPHTVTKSDNVPCPVTKVFVNPKRERKRK